MICCKKKKVQSYTFLHLFRWMWCGYFSLLSDTSFSCIWLHSWCFYCHKNSNHTCLFSNKQTNQKLKFSSIESCLEFAAFRNRPLRFLLRARLLAALFVLVFACKPVRHMVLYLHWIALAFSQSLCACVCMSIHRVYVSWSLQALIARRAPCRAARGLRCMC